MCSTPLRAATLAVRLDQCPERLEVERERIQRLADIAVNLARQKLAIEREAAEAAQNRLGEALRRAEAWYRSPLFVASLTALLTTGAILAARFLVIETQL